jgi:hypothetical protein
VPLFIEFVSVGVPLGVTFSFPALSRFALAMIATADQRCGKIRKTAVFHHAMPRAQFLSVTNHDLGG